MLTTLYAEPNMEYGERSELIHRVNDKKFSSIFSKKGKGTNQKYRAALTQLGLSGKFKSAEDNYQKLRKSENAVQQDTTPLSPLLTGPYRGCVLVDVPPEGDCWLLALLAPLLGYVVTEDRDQQNIIPTVRRRMAEIVLTASKQFLHLFGDNQKELETWAEKIQRWSPGDSQEKWGGTHEFAIFTQITGICVHVINRENQRWEPAVQHLVPRSFQENVMEGRGLDCECCCRVRVSALPSSCS